MALFVAAYQRQLHHLWNDHIFFAAGKTVEELSAWYTRYRKQRSSFWENDMTNYDSTITDEWQRFATRVLARAGGKHAQHFLGFKIAQSFDTRGKGTYGTRFRVKGTMKSGAADTCLTNSIINALSHWFCLHKLNPALTQQQLETQVALAIMGDDMLLIAQAGIRVEGIDKLMAKLGFMPKLKESAATGGCFLNMLPYPQGHGWRFAPRPGRILSRLGVSAYPVPDVPAYVGAVGKGFVAQMGNLPVLGALARMLVRVGHDRQYEKSWLFQRQHYDTMRGSRSPDVGPEALHYISALYGVTAHEVGELEAYFDGVSQLDVLLSHPVLNKLVMAEGAV